MSKRKSRIRSNILLRAHKTTPLKRSSLMFGFFVIVACSAYFISTHSSLPAYAVSSASYTCQPDGTFISGHTGSAALTASDTLAASKVMAWVHEQTKTRTVITTASTLAPDIEHATTYTGPIQGTFSLTGVSYPIKNDAPLTVTSPSPLSDSYAGVVQGHVLTTPTAWRWIIQVYKKTASGYVQVPKQALADESTGEFTIDLSDVANPPAGEWAFGILDATNSYAPYGIQWPAPNYYDGLEVQQKLVTDGIYDWSSTRANTDGTFYFDNSNTGKKLFRLVDTQSGDVLAEYVKSTGLLRSYKLSPGDPSYGTAFEDRSFVYDQAIALFAALGTGDEQLATTLVEGLLTLQQTSTPHKGGFVFASSQLTPDYRDVLIRTGAHAIATDALLAYIDAYPSSPRASLYKSRAVDALSFLDTTLSHSGTTTGLYTGGYGDYSGVGNSFNASTVISWASTEHNIDIWHAFTRASRVLGNESVDYRAKASSLQSTIDQKLFNASEARYNQGMTTSGEDTADPLDVHSWGAIQQYAYGETERATSSLVALNPFTFTQAGVTGYAAFYNSSEYPGALPNVWFEGTFGVALAQLRIGDSDAYRTTLNNAKPAQHSDGSFDYVTTSDAAYELYPRASVASTAWYVLATTGSNALWNYCTYTQPAQESPTSTTPTSSSSPRASHATPHAPSEITEAQVALQEAIEQSSGSKSPSAPQTSTPPLHETPQETNEKAQGLPLLPVVGSVSLVGVAAVATTIVIRRYKNGS